MGISRGEKEEQREARTTTDESMDPKAPQEWTGMLSGSVNARRIRVTTSPS
jgi:hypothetical protein